MGARLGALCAAVAAGGLACTEPRSEPLPMPAPPTEPDAASDRPSPPVVAADATAWPAPPDVRSAADPDGPPPPPPPGPEPARDAAVPVDLGPPPPVDMRICNAQTCCSADDCPAPTNSNKTCVERTCGWTCASGFQRCGEACIAESLCCGADASIDLNGNRVADCKENLLPNGQFTRDVEPWDASHPAYIGREWTPMDANGRPESGSIKVINKDDAGVWSSDVFLKDVAIGATYAFHADYFIPAGQAAQGVAAVNLTAHGEGSIEGTGGGPIGTTKGAWARGTAMMQLPPGTTRLHVGLSATITGTQGPFNVLFDNVLLVRLK